MGNIENIYRQLLEPSPALISDMQEIEGDIIILGVGGKMGPGIARLAKQAVERAGIQKTITGVSRFSEKGLQQELEADGIKTIAADLLDDEALQALPETKNVLYLAGTKFGTGNNAPFTWAMNSYLPGRVAQKYKSARIVVFSTGNVYPMVPVTSGGATEHDAPEPLGEYAQSCLGRERLFQYYASLHHTPLLIYRLNYSNDLTYGVLIEIARCVFAGKPVELSMGNVNVIWQGDANEMAIRSLRHCSVPAKILNVTGPETVSVRWAAEEFGRLFGKPALFINEESSSALLSNASESFRLFGYPGTTLKQMMELMAEWILQGGKLLNKETHFQERKGKY